MELIKGNNTKEKTKDIKFASLEMSEYLKENKKTHLSKIIFSLKSGILDIKKWNIWSTLKKNMKSDLKCLMSETRNAKKYSVISHKKKACLLMHYYKVKSQLMSNIKDGNAF